MKADADLSLCHSNCQWSEETNMCSRDSSFLVPLTFNTLGYMKSLSVSAWKILSLRLPWPIYNGFTFPDHQACSLSINLDSPGSIQLLLPHLQRMELIIHIQALPSPVPSFYFYGSKLHLRQPPRQVNVNVPNESLNNFRVCSCTNGMCRITFSCIPLSNVKVKSKGLHIQLTNHLSQEKSELQLPVVRCQTSQIKVKASLWIVACNQYDAYLNMLATSAFS